MRIINNASKHCLKQCILTLSQANFNNIKLISVFFIFFITILSKANLRNASFIRFEHFYLTQLISLKLILFFFLFVLKYLINTSESKRVKVFVDLICRQIIRYPKMFLFLWRNVGIHLQTYHRTELIYFFCSNEIYLKKKNKK